MFCDNCLKLSIIPQNFRKCIRCQTIISNNLSCICDNCSTQNGVCSICLKRLIVALKVQKPGCGCGGKK